MFAGRKGVLRFESSWTTGSDVPGTPTWTVVDRAGDVTVAGAKNTAELMIRATDFILDVGGGKNLSITAALAFSQDIGNDAIYDTLRDAWLNDTPMLFEHLTKTTSGGHGFRMPMLVGDLPHEFPWNNAVNAPLVLRPTTGYDASGDLILPTKIEVA